MGAGKNVGERRVGCHGSFKRFQRDNQNINHMEHRVMDNAEGKILVRKARFLTVSGSKTSVGKTTLERARQLVGLKGCFTKIPGKPCWGTKSSVRTMTYGKLRRASGRPTKHDLKSPPSWRRKEDAITAHLTVVFTRLAIGRHLQELSGVSVKKIITTLKANKSARILASGEEFTAPAEDPEDFNPTLQSLKSGY